ncbi:PIG-L family deacetylase [Candidatus Woesearchaeota archaeon]|nr:PIG-L family deacetylase [Candidatus Woesearchaeota archaeon]
MDALQLRGKRIMVIVAHPDDAEFIAGGTVARAVSLGCEVSFIIATKGERGSSERGMTAKRLAAVREREQRAAAKVLGIESVEFLGFLDGELQCDLKLKEAVVRQLRRRAPDMVITFDPAFLYSVEQQRVNHADHRAIGEAVMDAVYPLARDLMSFPGHANQGLAPHKVAELCFSSGEEGNAYCDITSSFERKILALQEHKSQVKEPKELQGFLLDRHQRLGIHAKCELAECFKRIALR